MNLARWWKGSLVGRCLRADTEIFRLIRGLKCHFIKSYVLDTISPEIRQNLPTLCKTKLISILRIIFNSKEYILRAECTKALKSGGKNWEWLCNLVRTNVHVVLSYWLINVWMCSVLLENCCSLILSKMYCTAILVIKIGHFNYRTSVKIRNWLLF
jgi:hypothetical protein